jgi:cobalt/nickel transport system permease protein
VLNLGVVAPLAGYAIYDLLRGRMGGLFGTVAGAVTAAWFTVMAAATLCAVQLSWGGSFAFRPTLALMLLVHSVIGVGEALVTGCALTFILQVRPDLIYGRSLAGRRRTVRGSQLAAAGLAIALVMAALLSPFASVLPDGLENSLSKLGREAESVSLLPAPFADYHVQSLESLGIAGSAAGVLGTLVVFGIAIALARRFPSRPVASHL